VHATDGILHSPTSKSGEEIESAIERVLHSREISKMRNVGRFDRPRRTEHVSLLAFQFKRERERERERDTVLFSLLYTAARIITCTNAGLSRNIRCVQNGASFLETCNGERARPSEFCAKCSFEQCPACPCLNKRWRTCLSARKSARIASVARCQKPRRVTSAIEGVDFRCSPDAAGGKGLPRRRAESARKREKPGPRLSALSR